ELAMSINVDSGFAVPTEIPDLAQTVSLISRITKEDPREVFAKCKASRSFCWVARKADAETVERIKALNLRGVYFQKESKRFYPKRDLAAQVLGYVGMDDEGLSGIEREYDEQLRGKSGRMLVHRTLFEFAVLENLQVDETEADGNKPQQQHDPQEVQPALRRVAGRTHCGHL
ncbi:MAG: hypothetical protein DMG68_01300, partial [Acidobacteria bacterium]